MTARRIFRNLKAGATSLLLTVTACTVGPDFKRPAAPAVPGYTGTTLPAETAASPAGGGAAQRYDIGRDIPAAWWALFHSPALNRLVTEAIQNNPNLQSAEAALRQAHELTRAGQGALYPSVQAGLAASRNKTAATLSPATANGSLYYSLYTADLTVSYVPDVFGGTRRQIETLAAQEEAQRFEVEATYLTLTSNLVAAAVTEAALRGQLAATQEAAATQRDALTILRRQEGLGQIAGADVAIQEAALAQAEASIPPLQKQLAQQRDLLAVLLGRYPSQQPSETFDLAALTLPQDLPVSLPSQLVEQRPDIRAAEAQLHAASAQIGVAIANRLPQITLSANPGVTATTLSQLFIPGAGFWSIGGSVAQTLFDGGTLGHRQHAAEAALDEAAAQYRATVQTAFQNVADTLAAVHSDADALTKAVAARQAAATSLAIAKRQLALGAVNSLALLTAENADAQARNALVIAQAARFSDTAALFQALGGGWWNRPTAPDTASTAEPTDAGKASPQPRG
ncbi:MAG: efflux transporter outer membrane subunit [Alphaproteobacteria bacterium]|nr:efflux transporter outer membrane subunit [Alphaproteobacteria bacterium]